MSALSVACPQCGTHCTGKFCSECGASLSPDSETLGEEVKSKFINPAVATLAFIKPMWLLFLHPKAFCKAYFHGAKSLATLPFPLSKMWRFVSSGPQGIARPFPCLATAVGLVSLVTAMDDAGWRLAGLEDTRQNIANNQEQGIQDASQRTFGHGVQIFDLGSITGIGPLDAALATLWSLFHYLFFAMLVTLFIPRRVVARKDLIHYFAYAMSVAVVLYCLAGVVAILFFISLSGQSLNAAMSAEEYIQEGLGHLPEIYFLMVVPIVVFPQVLPLSRRRVALAMLGGAALWMSANFLISTIMLKTGTILN